MHRLQNFYPCTSVCLVPAHKHTLKTSKLKLEIKSQTFGAFNGTFIQSEAWESHIPPASNPPQNVLRHSRHSRLLHTPLETCLPQAVPLPAPGVGTAAGALPALAPLPPGAVGLDPLPQPDGSCSWAASCKSGGGRTGWRGCFSRERDGLWLPQRRPTPQEAYSSRPPPKRG